MAKMNTLLAGILTILNIFSLFSILSLSFMKTKDKNDLTYVIIVAIGSVLFIILLISSFCLTENECCGTCCPAKECCLCFKEGKEDLKEKENDKKSKDCCKVCSNLLIDCCCRPIGSCSRKIGKHGMRYCSLIFLSLAHIGMAVLCFYTTKKTNEKMYENTIIIVIICCIVVLINFLGIITPCFNCCKRCRYVSISTKELKSENKGKKNKGENINASNDESLEISNEQKETLIQKENSGDFDDINNNLAKNKNDTINDNHNNDFKSIFGIKREESNKKESKKS